VKKEINRWTVPILRKVIKTKSTAAKADAICIDIEMDRHDSANWPDLLDNWMADVLV
jgi:hypothetical protein